MKTEDLQETSDNPSWLLKQALRAFDKKHFRCASWLCWIEIHRNPNNYFALCEYAQSLYHLGKANDRKAASVYKRAIGIKPAHPLAHAGLGLIHCENAHRIYQEYSMFPGGSWLMSADEQSPENENKSSLITSHADSQVGNRKIAIKELEEAANLTSDRDDKVGLLNMAAEIHCMISYEKGIEAYKKILDIAPDYVGAHFNLAYSYAATGKRELALQEYEFITEHAPELASDLESKLAHFNMKINRMEKEELSIHTRYYNQINTAWGSFASYYRENVHLVSNLRNLKICHKCYQLYGLVRLQDDQVVTQKCGCNWSYDDERWHETIKGITYYHHHNKEYEICHCCGLEIIRSGSIWSLLYCQDCKARVNKFNEMAGKCIIPYGRYSVMNNVSLSLSVENSKDKKAIGEFVTAANNMNQSIGIIDEYSKTITEKQVRLLHMTEDAPVIDLLLKTSGLELNELKKEAFVMMLIALGFGRVIEVVLPDIN